MQLTRIEPESNMCRFYRIEIVRGLFGDWGLVREWGRVGRSGTVHTDWFGSEMEALDARLKLQAAKRLRGYIVQTSSVQGVPCILFVLLAEQKVQPVHIVTN